MNDPSDEEKKAYSDFASILGKVEEDDKKAKRQILKDGILERENSKKSTVMGSRVLASTVSGLREKADMSAFVGTGGKIKSPRFNRSKFIELLAREILVIGNEELKELGGVVTLERLSQRFDETRDNWELRDRDIADAVKYLKKKKMIPNLESLSEEIEIIYFKPVELSSDTKQILLAAHGIEMTRSNLITILGWQEARVDQAINLLHSLGLVIIDGDQLYFPGL